MSAPTFTLPESMDATGKVLDLMMALKRSLDICGICNQAKGAHLDEKLTCPAAASRGVATALNQETK